jgi:signal transduction histidine kinase
LIAAQAASIVVTVLTLVTALVTIRYASGKAAEANEVSDELMLVYRLTEHATRFAAASRRAVLTNDSLDRARAKELRLELDRARVQLGASARFDPAEVSVLGAAVDSYLSVLTREVAEPGIEGAELRDQLARLEAELAMRRDAIDRAADSLIVHQRNSFAESRVRSERLTSRARWTLVFISGISILLGVGVVVVVMRELGRHSKQARAAAEIARRIGDSRRELVAASHDLRAPLKSIIATASSLEQSRELDEIASAARDVDQLLEELFDLSRVQLGAVSLRYESCNAETLVERAVQALLPEATARAIRLRADARISDSVHADGERIRQVLATLIATALKAARPGGEILLTAASAESSVRFAVVDVGAPGLPDFVATMFPRHSARNEASSGMGMYICKRIVEAHGGRMGIELAAGRGNTYWFTLPTGPRHLR